VATRIRHIPTARLALIGVVALVVVGFGVYWFGPQKLFLDTKVDEQLARDPSGASGSTLAKGSFRSLAHESSGIARIVELDNGRVVLELENLDVLAGPDLRVYLSTASATSSEDEFDDDFIDLGDLRANQGNLVYEVPSGADISAIRSVAIWCRRFDVGFGVAPLLQK
jgi:hypothetical protein